jgi:hypothetical protein
MTANSTCARPCPGLAPSPGVGCRGTDLLGRLNPALRGWWADFRHGVSKTTFGYLDSFAWHRVEQMVITEDLDQNFVLLLKKGSWGPDWQPRVPLTERV